MSEIDRNTLAGRIGVQVCQIPNLVNRGILPQPLPREPNGRWRWTDDEALAAAVAGYRRSSAGRITNHAATSVADIVRRVVREELAAAGLIAA